MATAHVIVTIIAIAANAFSGVAAMLRPRALREPMARIGVPESWLVFPIGTAKLAGAVGLLVGLLGPRPIGIAAAIGLVCYWTIAVLVHLRARDYSAALAAVGGFFLPLAVASLVLGAAA